MLTSRQSAPTSAWRVEGRDHRLQDQRVHLMPKAGCSKCITGFKQSGWKSKLGPVDCLRSFFGSAIVCDLSKEQTSKTKS